MAVVPFANFQSGRFITAIVVNPPERRLAKRTSVHCTEVQFASFFSGGFITAIVVNPPEKRLSKRTSVHWSETRWLIAFLVDKVVLLKEAEI